MKADILVNVLNHFYPLNKTSTSIKLSKSDSVLNFETKTKTLTSFRLKRKGNLTQKSKVRVYKHGCNNFIRKEFLKTEVKTMCECFSVLLTLLNVKTWKHSQQQSKSYQSFQTLSPVLPRIWHQDKHSTKLYNTWFLQFGTFHFLMIAWAALGRY